MKMYNPIDIYQRDISSHLNPKHVKQQLNFQTMISL